MSIPDLTPPWTRIPLVHETTDLFDPETQDALDLRYSAGGAIIPDASTTTKGVVELATTGETTTGTDTTRAVTPAGVQAVRDILVTGEAAVNTVAAAGSTETLSAAYQLHNVTMDQNCTFSFTSPSAGAVFAVLLSGAFVPTWPGTVDWPDGTLPTYTSPSLYVFATFDGGTTWEGVQSGKAFA
jgi:hypothetical protein